MLLPRHIGILLRRAAQDLSPVLLQGPRGAGKSTLLRREFPDHLHIDLDAAAERGAARRDPIAFLTRLRRAAVVDNVQRAPEMVRALERPPELPIVFSSCVRLSLPIATLELHPATRAERERRPSMPLSILGRFVPAAVPPMDMAPPWPQSRAFLQQDVRNLINVNDLDRFERFADLVQVATGELMNQQETARRLGVSHRTVVRWLEVLERCFLTVRVEPLAASFGRRLVRSPKLHWLGATGCFETEVVTEIYRNARHAGLDPVLRYWRDSNGLEVPLIVESEPSELIPVAIAEVPNPAVESRLVRWMDLAGVRQGALVGRSGRFLERRSTRVLRYGLDQF